LLELLLSSSTQPCHIWPLFRPLSVSFCFPTVSALAIQKAIKRLRPRKFVGLYSIPGFIIKGCSAIWVPALKYLFNFNASQKHFLTQWKQAVIAPVYKKGNDTYLQNYWPISLPNYFSSLWTCYAWPFVLLFQM
jgi:hypothetical protein